MDKKRKQRIEWPQIIQVLGVLERNEMNKQRAADELEVSRQTVYKYYSRYWKEYLEYKHKTMVLPTDIVPTEVVIPAIVADISEISTNVGTMYASAVDLVTKRLRGAQDTSAINDNQLINLVSTLTPYFLAKKEAVDEEGKAGTGAKSSNTFIQNFIDTVNGYDKGKKENK